MRTKIAVSAALGLGLVFGASAPALSENLTSADEESATDLEAAVVPGQELEPITDGKIEKGETAYVDVTVATLWTDSKAPRKADKPALGHPVDLDKWNKNLKSTDVRRGLTGKVETQAVYGSQVTVLKTKGKWAYVSVKDQSTPKNDRGYPGWVPTKQLVENDRFGQLKDDQPRAVVTAKKADLEGIEFTKDTGADPSFNVELPLIAQDVDDVRVALPGGGAAWMDIDDVAVYDNGEKAEKPSGDDLVKTAKQFDGLRYLWAGVSAYGFDCSGFTYSIYRAHGIDIPRDSGEQAKAGKKVSSDDLKPGDLLFFSTSSGTVHHVGMYIGDGKMIHSPNASKDVYVTDWKSWDTGNEFSGARRIL
ncbi:C40 family peptidase [Brevibacterium sp. ZH18]|uniref:C40 family peptidase n=1 Tax=Brevibacterium sp. ZH18 TaxID=2927784 RepID=UPI001F61ABE9|nr:C40 family peptidase [Brevibacterium sp. ZH18]MCI4012794.1 C40 family peptidase [Brevibacterium sp. ZH18]